MPALSESETPLTMEAVELPGLYVILAPRPIAIPMGVVMPYKAAPAKGTQL